MNQNQEHLSTTEQWRPALEKLFLPQSQTEGLTVAFKERLLDRTIDERSLEVMKMPNNYPQESNAPQPLSIPPQPVLARWTLPFLLEQGYQVEQIFDVDKIASANDVVGVGHPGGDWLLRRMEQKVSEVLGLPHSMQNQGDIPDRLFLSIGGDEYMIMKKRGSVSEDISVERINADLQDVQIAFKSRDKKSKKGFEWKSVSVKGAEASEVKPYDETRIEAPVYEPLYQTVFSVDEADYLSLPKRVRIMMKDSLFDPVLADHEVLKSAHDALKILRGNNPQMDHCSAFAFGINGLKEANTQNKGDQFLRDVYSDLQKGIDLISEGFGIDKQRIRVVRNRGATFIFLIDGMLSQEQKLELETFLRVRVGNEKHGILVFPGVSYQDDFTNADEVVSLVDIAERRQNIIIMKALLDNLRADSGVNNRKLIETLEGYFNDPKRGSRRRKGMSETITNLYYIYHQLGTLPDHMQTLERWQREYGDRRTDVLREGPFEDIEKLALYLQVPYNKQEN